jgi:PTH1 family peptidyl-tRNA hydrolase
VADPILLIVGLGNPGRRYTGTRHNAGYSFIEAIIGDVGAELRREERFEAWTGTGSIGGNTIRLLAPQTYMNRSGASVTKFVRFFKIPVHQMLIAHDDLDLAPGTVRLKIGGGHGGHNGLRDIFDHLGSSDFVRLRIGIGHPGSSSQVTNYVLSPPNADETAAILDAIQAARRELPSIVHGELQLAMNALHSREQDQGGSG